MVPASNDTLLRLVRRRACSYADDLRVVGIDDWAFRRNHRYGTIVCELERRRIVTLLPVARSRPSKPGLRTIHRSRLCRVIVAAAMGSDRKSLPNASAAFCAQFAN